MANNGNGEGAVGVAPPGNVDLDGPLRSKASNKHAYIRFMNMTRRKVDVIWINYEGVRVKYKVANISHFWLSH